MNEITYIPPHNIDLSRDKDEGQFVINNQNEKLFIYYDLTYKKGTLENSIQNELKNDIKNLKQTSVENFSNEIQKLYNKYSPFTESQYGVARRSYFQCFLISQIDKDDLNFAQNIFSTNLIKTKLIGHVVLNNKKTFEKLIKKNKNIIQLLKDNISEDIVLKLKKKNNILKN